MTTNFKENIDTAILRKGRVNMMIEMKKCDHYQIKKMFKRFIGREIDNDVLMKIPEDSFTPADIIEDLKMFIKQKDVSDSEIMENFMQQ